MELPPGHERFTARDLHVLSDLVGRTWAAAADRDWSVPAGGLDWSCLAAADHAVDCVYAPAFFLASRKLDDYPEAGSNLMLGPAADPMPLIESLAIATRILVAVVNDAPDKARAVIFRRPEILIAGPPDFLPRGAMELILHCHDVCAGLQVPFEPPLDLCHRLREHTRNWPMWNVSWQEPGRSDDAWGDLLAASGRARSRAS